MEWKSAGVRVRRSKPLILRATCGQSRFALPLNRGPILPKGCGSAGTAGMPTFIWTGPERWMWAYATGLREFWVEKERIRP